jgi:hypothetical protein
MRRCASERGMSQALVVHANTSIAIATDSGSLVILHLPCEFRGNGVDGTAQPECHLR